MPFIIQGQDVAAVPETQSPWYETDIAILVAGIAGTGVLTGCAVTAQGTPDMTVAVASGTIQPSAGVAAVTVTGANKAITAADGDDPRIDLVSASAAGVLTVTDGTPEPIVPGMSGPKPPDLPSGHIALAMVDVPATDTTIGTAQITDKRAMVFAATGVADILDLPTAENDDTLVLAPDGTGGVEFRAETGGGGGITQSYVGTNSVGGTTDALTSSRIIILKQIVLATAGFIPSVEIYCAGNANNPEWGWASILTTDSAGAPGILLATTVGGAGDSAGVFQDATYRWRATPLGVWLTAGTYWIGVISCQGQYNRPNTKYEGTGTDRYGAPAQYFGETGGWPTSTDRNYSLRASVLR